MTIKKENDTASPSAGGLRYNSGKMRWSLISLHAAQELVHILEGGAVKYAPWNWANGLSWNETYDSLVRHLNKWFMGEERDPESGRLHLGHVFCNAMFLLHFAITGTGTDDRPLAQRAKKEEALTNHDNQRRYPTDATITTTTNPTSGTARTSETKLPDTVVQRGLFDLQENVRPEAPGDERVKFIHGDDSGEWWYIADGRVGRYDYAGNRIG
jgi:hypothetical protein